ncbi:hypothetical protein CASFOL_040073 [Castilleja foliolosa]|uniref:Uncharacterized protein n=1 Tax=Castilleja foliolosa TaxID=1961234 RepID=A0ABD3BET4_9LAMI
MEFVLHDEIVEGGLYRIKNFIVWDNNDNNKTTSHRHKLFFYRSTHFGNHEDDEFPNNIRDLNELSNIQNIDDTVQMDVIGRVVSYQQPCFVP